MGVLDEVELVGPAIEHLFHIGVDRVIVFDMGSTDGTLAAVEAREGPAVELHRLRNDLPWDELRVRTVEAIRARPADWVLFQDADEFWLPAGGSLRACDSLARADIVQVPRYNVAVDAVDGVRMPVPPAPEHYPGIEMYTRKIADFRRHMAENPDTPWIAGVPAAKVIARADCIDEVTMGSHNVEAAAGRPVRRVVANDMLIAHVPVSSAERFQRRADNICEFMRLNPGYLVGAQGWHWKRLHQLALEGRVEEEYACQLTDAAGRAALRESGVLATAAEMLSLAAQRA